MSSKNKRRLQMQGYAADKNQRQTSIFSQLTPGQVDHYLRQMSDRDVYKLHNAVIRRLAVVDLEEYIADRRDPLEVELLELKKHLFDSSDREMPYRDTEFDIVVPESKDTFSRDEVIWLTRLARFDEFVNFAEFAREEYDPVTANEVEIQGLLRFLGGISGVAESRVFRDALRAYPTNGDISLDEYTTLLGLRAAKHGLAWETDVSSLIDMLKDLSVLIANVLHASDDDANPDKHLRAAIARYVPFIVKIEDSRKGVSGGREKQMGWRWVADEILKRCDEDKGYSAIADNLHKELSALVKPDHKQREMLKALKGAKPGKLGERATTWVSRRQRELKH